MADFKHLVRIANTDLSGNKAIGYALRRVKGVGFQLANAVCHILNLDINTKVGTLNDSQIKKINDVVTSIDKQGLPAWLLNRRKDYETGEDTHLLTNQLIFTRDNDIKRLRRIKSYKGFRHGAKLPVRGQRTKSNFRPNKGKVQGVKRK